MNLAAINIAKKIKKEKSRDFLQQWVVGNLLTPHLKKYSNSGCPMP